MSKNKLLNTLRDAGIVGHSNGTYRILKRKYREGRVDYVVQQYHSPASVWYDIRTYGSEKNALKFVDANTVESEDVLHVN